MHSRVRCVLWCVVVLCAHEAEAVKLQGRIALTADGSSAATAEGPETTGSEGTSSGESSQAMSVETSETSATSASSQTSETPGDGSSKPSFAASVEDFLLKPHDHSCSSESIDYSIATVNMILAGISLYDNCIGTTETGSSFAKGCSAASLEGFRATTQAGVELEKTNVLCRTHSETEKDKCTVISLNALASVFGIAHTIPDGMVKCLDSTPVVGRDCWIGPAKAIILSLKTAYSFFTESGLQSCKADPESKVCERIILDFSSWIAYTTQAVFQIVNQCGEATYECYGKLAESTGHMLRLRLEQRNYESQCVHS